MGLEQVKSGVEDRLKGMITRGKSVSAYMNRVLLKEYKDAQNERWQTQGASQEKQWAPLSPLYVRQKKKRFASFPGGGNKMMVATSRLSAGALGLDSQYYYKIVTDNSFIFGINLGALPYAKYPGVRRPFMSFSDNTLKKWMDGIANYVGKGKE